MESPARRQLARYPVVFRVGEQAPMPGALLVGEERLLLQGGPRDRRIELGIPYQELREVRIGRAPGERLNGRPALLIARSDGPTVQVEPLGAGILHELADLLSTLATAHAEADEHVAVILPLKKGRLSRARELLAQGPPFDPARLGLARHEVFLSPTEVTFVFGGKNVRAILERATRDPSLWRVGLAWRDCIGGRPRLADAAEARRAAGEAPVYSWAPDGDPAP